MAPIRPFDKKDIAQVADLHERVFRGSDRPSSEALRSYFADIFFCNPWYDKTLPSLVYENSQGEVVGFLGVVPRRMSFRGKPLLVAVSTQFMVDPKSRASLAAVQLLKSFLSGPQDLSLCDASYDSSRKIWEALGGSTALLYSLQWTRPLRPSRYVMSLLTARKRLSFLEFAANPFCRVLDTLAARMPGSPFRQLAPGISGEDLKGETLVECLSEFVGSRSLRPEYDDRTLPWLLEKAAQKKGLGVFRKVVVRGPEQETLGWYLYYLNPGGLSEVIQVAARETSITEVLDHLFYDAWKHGAAAVSGALDPRFMREYSIKHCLFRCGGYWTLVHSRDSEVVQAIHRGDAYLTRLDGEWWMRFLEREWGETK